MHSLKRSRSNEDESIFVARPTIPIPCIFAFACVVGVFAAGYVSEVIEQHILGLICIIGFFACVVSCSLAFWCRAPLVVWAVLFFVFGMLVALLQQAQLVQDRESIEGQTERYRFTLIEDAKSSSFGSRVMAQVENGSCVGKKVQLFLSDDACLLAGDVIEGDTHLVVPSDEFLNYYDSHAISLSASLPSYSQVEDTSLFAGVHELRKRSLRIIGSGSEERTLMRAVLLGERTELFDADFYHDIKIAGLAHLVAVSGAHLVIVAGFVALLIRRLKASSKIAVALQLVFLVVYLVLVGFPISCVRAALMSALTLFALLARRRSSSLTAIGIATLAIVIFDPSSVHQLSFQLSVAATLGIVLFMQLFCAWGVKLAPWMPKFARDSLAMTLSALVFSLPISASQFALVPLFSPLGNLIATPYLTVLLAGGFISILLIAVFPQLLGVVEGLAQGFLIFIDLISKLPGAALPVLIPLWMSLLVAVVASALVWVVWPTPEKIDTRKVALVGCSLAVVLVVTLLFRPGTTADRIIMLDVGQGDSFVLSSEGRNLLIDTGNEPVMLYAALARNDIDHVDAVLITHPDDDHCGCIEALVDVATVDSVIVAEGLIESEDEKAHAFINEASKLVGIENITEVTSGDTIRFGIFTLDIVSPGRVEHGGANEDSICLYARADCDKNGVFDWNAFFCGDAEEGVLEGLRSEGALEAVDIFKVGHHGSKKAITAELASVLHPKVALIGVGKNSYGHPSDEALEALSSVNAQVFRSDLNGDVVCVLETDSLHLMPQRSGA